MTKGLAAQAWGLGLGSSALNSTKGRGGDGEEQQLVILTLGRQREESHWGLLASQISQIAMLQVR